MALAHLPLEVISERDLQRLVDDRAEEHKSIDFKKSLPGGKDSEKKEFLADVSSFANAAGGALVFGVREEQGAATELCGFSGVNPDAEIRRLEESIQKGIAPRIPGIASRAIRLSSGAQAIIVRVPSSWAAPHMITFQEWSRFYSRNSKGKYPMDVSEIRAAFAASESLTERVRTFRKDRLTLIRAHETPVSLRDGALTVLHVVPFSALRPGAQVDLTQRDLPTALLPIGDGGSPRFNFDGFMMYTHETAATGYVQLFRNGCIEALDVRLLQGRVIPSLHFERELINAGSSYVAKLQSLGCQPPLVVMVSLLGVRGHQLGVSAGLSNTVERNDLLVPEVLADSFDFDAGVLLRPAFDAIWNACGYAQSANYDDAGRWSGGSR